MSKETAELYRVRTGSHGENLIHMPRNANGWYRMIVDKNGEDVHFIKVRV